MLLEVPYKSYMLQVLEHRYEEGFPEKQEREWLLELGGESPSD
jgi:hypothetical protein